jgi:hypothetical protein
MAISRLILVFWALWFSLVSATNVADALKALGWLSGDWPFASGNYALVAKTAAVYRTPTSIIALMFAGVIAWEAAATVLFWRAAVSRLDNAQAAKRVDQAFVASLSLWAAFLLADELFVSYAMAGTHLRLFVAHLVSLAFLRWMIKSAQ